MIDIKQFNDLRRRAEDFLRDNKREKQPNQDIYQIVEELNLYQIELEIQNDDLIKTQLDLQASHNKYVDLYNLAPVAYFTFNADGLVVDVNQAALDLLGMKKHVLINRCFSRYIAPEYQMQFSQYRQRVLKESCSHTCELKLLRWSGPAFDAQLECKAIQDTSTEQKYILMCVTDITERKLLEQSRHLHQVKMASIDRMRSMNEQIYSIAHNQNHSLSVIDNYIYGCIRRLEAEKYNRDELLQALKKISQQSRILANIILQMKNFASKTIFRYECANINTIIEETLSLIKYETLEFPVTVHYERINSVLTVKLDRLHIQQVILNLARNSIESMRDAKTSEPKLMIELRLTNKNIIEINMLDNGPGYAQDIAHKLFEPHFTTKSYAIGLGLSVSRTIVEKHGGQLFAQTNLSGGACFQMTLPCIAMAS